MTISGVMTFSTGIFLTIVRLVEPLFRHLTLKVIYGFWGVLYESQKEGQSEEELSVEAESLNRILASSLNVELVYIILKSITAFNSSEIDTSRLNNPDSGLIIVQQHSNNDKIKEIEIGSHISQVGFEMQVSTECSK